MKRSFLPALVFCLMLSISALADGETDIGGKFSCPPDQSCSAPDNSSGNSIITVITNFFTAG